MASVCVHRALIYSLCICVSIDISSISGTLIMSTCRNQVIQLLTALGGFKWRAHSHWRSTAAAAAATVVVHGWSRLYQHYYRRHHCLGEICLRYVIYLAIQQKQVFLAWHLTNELSLLNESVWESLSREVDSGSATTMSILTQATGAAVLYTTHS